MKTRVDEDFGTRLLLLLLTRGLLNGEQLTACQNATHELPEEFLIEQGWATREQMTEATAASFGLETVSPDFEPLQGVLPDELMLAHRVVPVERRGEALLVAAAAPANSQAIEELSRAFGGPIHFAIIDRLTLAEKLAPPVEPESEQAIPQPETDSEGDEPLIGGRFKLGERFLDGRFSILYRGWDSKTGLPVAIRHLESYFTSEDARAQTLREGRTLAQLRHPNLPRIRHLVSHQDDIYLVADEISGQTLAKEIEEEGAFEPELVRRYLKQLLQVVDFLHSQPQPIIHRDLRPSSILVSPYGTLRLAEFGLAKMGEAAAGTAATSFRSAGDPDFAAPEQLLGDTSSVKNDLYSVGALAYYMAVGRPPAPSLKRFAGSTVMAPLPAEMNPKVAEVIKRCLEPKPEDRCESAKELLELLATHEDRLPMMFLSPAISDATAPFEPETIPLDKTADLSEVAAALASPNPSDEGSLCAAEAESSKVPDAAATVAPAATEAPSQSKRSMWQLLFGRKKKTVVSDVGLGESYHEELQSYAFADLASMDIDRQFSRILPERVCRNIGGICIGRLSDTKITIACKDPTDVYIYDQLAMSGGNYQATLMRAEPDLIEHALEYIYKGDHLSPDTTWSKFLDQKRLDDLDLVTTNEQAVITFGDEALAGPVVAAVDRLIKEAISAEASDIHLEPFDTGMVIRYRIDGVLRVVGHHARVEASAMVKRLKVLANMDIAQERVTQGGRISLKVGSQEFDLRVSVVPVPAGESVVMRILKKGAFTLTLSDLGFAEETELRFRKILSQPHGMILVCGPTGSGKSTTLYASLKEIARPDRKLLTAEDPIEYQMPGIIQVQMNTAPKEEEKRVTFSKALREFLRQDPDVILVGEIRDQETAEIGIQAALTGHLLLSTLHTNDSIGIIARLRDMDCEPFQIGSVLLGGLAQRLARRVCQECREEVEIAPEYLPLFESRGIESPRAFVGRGCRRCHQTGHRGRLGVYELLEITPEVRSLINRSSHEDEIKKQALEQGFRDLLADGLHKVKAGLISLDEVLRVCKTL